MPIALLRTLDRTDPLFKSKVDLLFSGELNTYANEANAQAAALTLNSTNDTSATSQLIGTGAKTFTVSSGKSYQPGMYLVIADTAAASTNSMYGQITSYSTTSLVMNILSIRGSGTKTAWTISQSAAGFGTAADITNTPAGGIAATNVQAAVNELDVEKANIGDVQAQTYTALTTGGTLSAYTLTPVPAIAGYVANQSFFVNFHAASGAAPTLQINGLATPPQLVKQLPDGSYANIAAGDIPLGHRSYVMLISATQALVEILPQGKRLAQNLTASTSAVATGTTVIPLDDTIPQITEGDQYLSLAITPINANSTLEIEVSLVVSSSVVSTLIAALFRDATANALIASATYQPTATTTVQLTLLLSTLAGSTAATTFRVRAGGVVAGTTTLNGTVGTRLLGGVLFSNINIKEYLP